MRKFLLLFAAAGFLCACAELEQDVAGDAAEGNLVYASASYETGKQRISFGENVDLNELELRWNASGESISVFCGSASQTPVTFNQEDVSEDGRNAIFAAADYALTEGESYYALYPAQTGKQAPTSVSINLSRQNGASYDAGADKTFMYAKSVCTDVNEPLNFSFRHLTAAVRFDIVLPAEVSASSAESATIGSDDGLVTSAKFNITGSRPVMNPVGSVVGDIALAGPFEIKEVSGKKIVSLYFRMLADNFTNLKAVVLAGGKCYQAELPEERNFLAGNWYFTAEAKEAGVAPAATIKVISFNVRTSTADDGISNLFDGKNWNIRKSAAASLLREQAPVVFGVQEATKTQIDYLKNQLSGYGCYGLGRDDGAEAGEIMAIFYNTSEVTLGEHGTFWLSETPDEVSKGWGANYYRTATWAVFTHIETGKKFFCLNTHLDHETAAARTGSIALIIGKIAALNTDGYPVVITGDFNSKPTDSVLDPLEAVYSNTRVSSPVTDDNVTYNNYGEGNEKTIDHIFISSGFKSMEYRTITDKSGNLTYVSDHYPISSVLMFR